MSGANSLLSHPKFKQPYSPGVQEIFRIYFTRPFKCANVFVNTTENPKCFWYRNLSYKPATRLCPTSSECSIRHVDCSLFRTHRPLVLSGHRSVALSGHTDLWPYQDAQISGLIRTHRSLALSGHRSLAHNMVMRDSKTIHGSIFVYGGHKNMTSDCFYQATLK